MKKILNDLENIKNFIFAGNATITLKSIKTGKHFTFKIKIAKKDKNDVPFFVSVLNGPDNYQNYSYIGIITSDKKSFRLTKNSKVDSNSLSYKAFKYFFYQLFKNEMNTNLKVYHSGKCGRCGRKLTTPTSIERGLGPECAKKS